MYRKSPNSIYNLPHLLTTHHPSIPSGTRHFQGVGTAVVETLIHRAKHGTRRPEFIIVKPGWLGRDVDKELEDKLILVKGSRKFGLERVMHRLVEKIHKTVLEVSLESIAHNLKVFRGFLKPETKVMAMVKAFAYGAGSIEIARLLEFHGVDYLAVAYTDEAITLRNNGIDLPMMVMNATLDDPATLMKYQLEPEIYSINQLKAYLKKYKRAQQKLPAHLIVNTGMNRLGINPSELAALKEVKGNLSYRISTRVDLILRLKDETLKLMRDSGFVSVCYGVESGSQRMLNYMSKDITIKQVLEMDERLNKRWKDTKEDLLFQERFWSIFDKNVKKLNLKVLMHRKIKARFGAKFLRENQNLIK